MDAFTEFEHRGWERVANKYDFDLVELDPAIHPAIAGRGGGRRANEAARRRLWSRLCVGGGR